MKILCLGVTSFPPSLFWQVSITLIICQKLYLVPYVFLDPLFTSFNSKWTLPLWSLDWVSHASKLKFQSPPNFLLPEFSTDSKMYFKHQVMLPKKKHTGCSLTKGGLGGGLLDMQTLPLPSEVERLFSMDPPLRKKVPKQSKTRSNWSTRNNKCLNNK